MYLDERMGKEERAKDTVFVRDVVGCVCVFVCMLDWLLNTTGSDDETVLAC
jgi:hypothetical protein